MSSHALLAIVVFSVFFIGTTVLVWSLFGDTYTEDTLVEVPLAKYTTIQGAVSNVATSSLTMLFGTEMHVTLTKDTKVYYTAVQKINGEVLSQASIEGGIADIPVGSTVIVKIKEESGNAVVAEKIDYVIETDRDAKEFIAEMLGKDTYVKVGWVSLTGRLLTLTMPSVTDSAKTMTFSIQLPEGDIPVYLLNNADVQREAVHKHTPALLTDIQNGQEVYLVLDSERNKDDGLIPKTILVLPTI